MELAERITCLAGQSQFDGGKRARARGIGRLGVECLPAPCGFQFCIEVTALRPHCGSALCHCCLATTHGKFLEFLRGSATIAIGECQFGEREVGIGGSLL